MKFNRYKKRASVLALIALVGLTGCGSGSGSTDPNAGIGVVGPGGTVYSGTCTNGSSGASISAPISFQINNAYMDSANILGGQLPYAGAVGQLVGLGNGQVTGGQYMGQSAYGQVLLGITYGGAYGGAYPYQGQPGYNSGSYIGYPAYTGINQNTISLTGSVIPSPAMISEMSYGSGFSPYGGYGGGPGLFTIPGQGYNYPGSQPCVSNLAVNLGHWGSTLYGGQVFLYMNGGMGGFVLQF